MDRAEFAKRLRDIVLPSGTSPEDMQKMMLPVSEAIFQMMPSSLYRYRSCDKRHIEAFKNDTIYAVTADKFNDPYDTLVRYDQEWRMIDLTPRDVIDTSPSEIHYTPTAIFYGQHISTEHKAELHAIAQKNGIKEYEMYIDYTSPAYEMKWRGMG